MHMIVARNVNEALSKGLELFNFAGRSEESRNGPVLVASAPVTTVYSHPTERVLFCPIRDANPFFHLMEALWMMGGRNDVAWPAFFNAKFSQFSDNGKTFHGAYGHRWRRHFGVDQLTLIIDELKANPGTRRAVLSMWDPGCESVEPSGDFYVGSNGGKDVPCNTHIYFRIIDGSLDVTVCCRSNDVIWGAYGANAVHMSVLQEVVAHAVGVEVGRYFQVSNNYHIYTDLFPVASFEERGKSARQYNLYQSDATMFPLPIINTDFETWDAELQDFLDDPLAQLYEDRFFAYTAVPMYRAWYERKKGMSDGHSVATEIEAPDWREACVNWIRRRQK